MDFGQPTSDGLVRGPSAAALSSGTIPPARIAAGTFVSGVVAGHNGAGAVTLAGAKVGDKVIQAINLTDDTDARSSFEATITVAGQIQQSSASDLSTKTISFELLSQS